MASNLVATGSGTGESPGSPRGVIFSGMRPTGRLHLGNYLGALQNWVDLQQDYRCIYCAVDIHALTTVETAEDTAAIQPNIEDMVLDWLAAGVDPERHIVFVQSHVPEVMSLNTLLSMVTPLGWLLRVPTFKEKVRQMDETEDSVNYGLVGYPVLQTADIILYKADTVPVGQDQVPHLELAREIVRRFNNRYGETFPEPQAKLTEAPLILGLDGQQKMSKSLDNHLELAGNPGGHNAPPGVSVHRPAAATQVPTRDGPRFATYTRCTRLSARHRKSARFTANAPPPRGVASIARGTWRATSTPTWNPFANAGGNSSNGPATSKKCWTTEPSAPALLPKRPCKRSTRRWVCRGGTAKP